MSEPVAADPASRPRLRKRWIAGGALIAIAAGLWFARAPIADSFIRDQLDQRGVPARYTIERIGLRTQRLTDIVIGDPARPDLTARRVEVVLDWGFTGPYVARIDAEGVRLYGAFADGRLSFGALDKFRDPTSTSPFVLPDLAVTLADARARVGTPWGAIGAALNGKGNLRRDFDGTLALVAPTLAAAGCSGRDVSFYGRVRVRDVRPQLVGPLRGASLACAGGKLTAASPQIALDLSLSEDLRQWRGTADASIVRLAAGPAAAERIGARAQFSGDAGRTAISVEAAMAGLRADAVTAEQVALTARATVGDRAPKVDGELTFARARAGEALRRAIVQGGGSVDGSPVGPLAERAATALAAMLAETGGKARFALAGEGKSARIELVAPELRGASGAYFTGSDDSRIAYLLGAPEPAVIAAGQWAFGGGGLPSGSLQLDRHADGTIAGVATVEPYAAGGARLALAPVRFSGGALLRFATRAELSGPVGDGRVERLSVPLAGLLAPNGALALDGGCTRIGADRVDVGGFRLAPTRIDLCSRPSAPLLSAGPQGLRGHIRVPGIALRGTSGTSPFAFDARGADIDLAAMRWALAGAEVRLGEGDGATHFAAASLTGRRAAQGMGGDLKGAGGKIGAVPLILSDIAGAWRWGRDGLTLDGGVRLTDAEPDARFFPLVADGAHLRFADGTIDAEAAFREEKSGRSVVDTTITHRLDSGTGAADLKVRELRFDDRFQPDQLTRLALGVVANVQGSVVGDGRIEWTPDGVTSHGTFATADANLAAAFGPVTGLTATLTFDDLIGLRSAPGQVARIDEINPGIPVIGGTITYRLLGDNRVRIDGGRWPFAGGELSLHPTTLDFNASQTRRLSFDIVGVDAAIFLQQFGFDNINATGLFDGTLPVEFDGLGGRIVGGRIDARAGGGTLAYVGELSNHNLGAIANFAFGALRSLQYDDLTIILNGDLDGEMVTDIRFGGVGQGEGATRNFLTKQIARLPLVFNVKIQAPFRQLITSAKGFYDPTLLIEQNLSTLLRVQEEAEAAAAAASKPVQPPESEPMP
ncbi:YdbH domain-containing protein [Sphingopyxis granuli]|uniref:YdbH domain-containing protein n=1 Tax=Sphingopyxis granuli TaxID=267128 RepID=UPI00301D7589